MSLRLLNPSRFDKKIKDSWHKGLCYSCGKPISKRFGISSGYVTSITKYLPKRTVLKIESLCTPIWADVVVHKNCLRGKRL